MAIHSLDRPVWHALRTRQASFAVGGEWARRFAADVSPLAAACDDSPDSLAELAALVPPNGQLLLLQVGDSPSPPGIAIERTAAGVQMIAEEPVSDPGDGSFEALGEADGPEMLALATLTEPGPFLARTHKLGGFIGIKEDGRLVAMAGERLQLPGFTEVSGVCVHPAFRGRGYARLLSQAVAARIARRGEVPFLHAYAGNMAAIRLYESLGFRVRTPVVVTVLRRG